MAQAMEFELVSPEKLVMSGKVTQVVVPGAEGYFTVMSNHAPVMATLKTGVIEARLESGEEKKLFVRGGFADVTPYGLTILAERADDLGEFDMAELDQQIQDAKEDVADAKDAEKKAEAELQLSHLEAVKAALSQE